jgi:hypothetical protein
VIPAVRERDLAPLRISSATYYKWKPKYGGRASDVKWLKELEDENSRVKRLYADLLLENAALKDGPERTNVPVGCVITTLSDRHPKQEHTGTGSQAMHTRRGP